MEQRVLTVTLTPIAWKQLLPCLIVQVYTIVLFRVFSLCFWEHDVYFSSICLLLSIHRYLY